jgi:hypothetical protein
MKKVARRGREALWLGSWEAGRLGGREAGEKEWRELEEGDE